MTYKASRCIEYTKTIEMSECANGFWLYDATRGMNISMRAKTKDDAFVEALTYYQNRLQTIESEYEALSLKVSNFVSLFADDSEED